MNRVYQFVLGTLLAMLLAGVAWAQLGGPRELRRINAQPDEMISMTRSMPFNQAMMIFSDLSKRKLNKIIIDPKSRTIPIGVNIENMHWLDALDLILRQNDLWYQEFPDHILLVDRGGAGLTKEELDSKTMYEAREVRISAIFFEADLTKLRSLGSTWSFLKPDSSVSITMSAAEAGKGVLTFEGKSLKDFGSIAATFRALESKNVGEVIASPQVTVRSGSEGRIQIGSDFSVNSTDFSGNTVTQFYSAGSIIKVTPEVLTIDTTTFIHLDLDVQKSQAGSSDLGVEIKKTSASTNVLLLDGEETLIGGLYSNEESVSRSGVPILKDLPWWVLGLRYIFGYESRSVTRKELMILVQAELLPTLEQRLRDRIARNNAPVPVLKNAREDFERDITRYQRQSDLFNRSQIQKQEEAAEDSLKAKE
ncbi:MAG: type II and III secretion system protein [bacterium]